MRGQGVVPARGGQCGTAAPNIALGRTGWGSARFRGGVTFEPEPHRCRGVAWVQGAGALVGGRGRTESGAAGPECSRPCGRSRAAGPGGHRRRGHRATRPRTAAVGGGRRHADVRARSPEGRPAPLMAAGSPRPRRPRRPRAESGAVGAKGIGHRILGDGEWRAARPCPERDRRRPQRAHAATHGSRVATLAEASADESAIRAYGVRGRRPRVLVRAVGPEREARRSPVSGAPRPW
ncbi:hypothetical protein C7821_109136 [Streptomyces sp. VMFN-G11Ma]|nr:hypothetical protein C7821_109136 [Streptomyces sp. VMFN-G11Ma]